MIREVNHAQTATHRKTAAIGLTKPVALAVDPGEPLSDEERDELQAHEENIERGARAWLEMGVALIEIRNKRLYRETHKTLEAYCWERFRLERSHAYRLMDAAKRYQVLLPIANRLGIQFSAESQVRSLVNCRATDLPDVLKLAAKKTEPDTDGNRIPSAKVLTAAVQELKNGSHGVDRKAGMNRATAAKREPGTRPQSSDPAAETILLMAEWSNSVLLNVARAMARELQSRGLIKMFDTQALPSKDHRP